MLAKRILWVESTYKQERFNGSYMYHYVMLIQGGQEKLCDNARNTPIIRVPAPAFVPDLTAAVSAVNSRLLKSGLSTASV